MAGCPLVISLISASLAQGHDILLGGGAICHRQSASDAVRRSRTPHESPRSHLQRDAWVRGHFQKRGRYCLVASLSLT